MDTYKIVEIKNGGLRMKVSSLGALITNLYVPDSKGKMGDIVLFNKSLEGYLNQCAYMGAVAGRVANRISDGKFSLDGNDYKLAKNEKAFGNHLHGGIKGFDKQVWDIKEISGDSFKGVALHYLSKDGEEGYPGNLNVNVVYKLSDAKQLIIEYTATTDKATLCNLTNHTYFNLSAGKSKDILSHELQVDADFYTPADKNFRPTGEILKVKGTPFDFTKTKVLGPVIKENQEFFKDSKGGIDHNYVLRNFDGQLRKAASLRDQLSGRIMDVYTTEPGLQIYTGNFLDSTIEGKGNKKYCKYAGICMETQHLPDAPTQSHFPNIALYPGEVYSSITCYAF